MDYLLHAAALSPPRTPPLSPASLSSPTSLPSHAPPSLLPAAPSPSSAPSSSPHVAAARAAASDAILTAGVGASFSLAAAVVRAAPLVEAPRRGERILPGRADTSVAAAYTLGGTSDETLRSVLTHWDLCAPRAARVKAAEAVWKERVRGMIAALNGGGGRESRAENLAALRVCEVVADVLDGFVARETAAALAHRGNAVTELQREVLMLQRALAEVEKGRVGMDLAETSRGDSHGSNGVSSGAASAASSSMSGC